MYALTMSRLNLDITQKLLQKLQKNGHKKILDTNIYTSDKYRKISMVSDSNIELTKAAIPKAKRHTMIISRVQLINLKENSVTIWLGGTSHLAQ